MKNLNQILSETTNIRYSRHAEQLACLALTKFIREQEKNGAKILSCSPRQIKLDNGTIKKVIGPWIKYTYHKEVFYYIQFNDNPFFHPTGCMSLFSGISTGLTELPMIFDNVNEYGVDEKNINQLVKNLYNVEKYLSELSLNKKDNVLINEFKQRIYNF